MRLYLKGHDYKYAVEQMLLTMFPEERPEYPEGKPAGDRLEIRLSRGPRYTTAGCSLWRDGQVFRGRAAAVLPPNAAPLEADRVRQRLVKNAIYRAALKSGVKKPAWGALTGVRPGKLLAGLLNEGLSEQQALKAFIRDYDVSTARAALCLDTSRETLKAMAALGPRDICLYVGIPFCPTRCAYCSFVSQSVEKSMKLIAPFHQALRREIAATAAQVKALGLRVVSVYMGGGTPTTLSAAQLDELCAWLAAEFDLSALREYTVEAGRPDTIDRGKLEMMKAHGVGRISVNPQTFSDETLRRIGRAHTGADTVRAYELARSLGFDDVNMDLIAALPGETPEIFSETLDRVIELNPESVTVHALAIKRSSRLHEQLHVHAGSHSQVSADGAAEMIATARRRLTAAGWRPYYLYRQKYMAGNLENVGYAKPGKACLYNIGNMEETASVLALGAGAITKWLYDREITAAARGCDVESMRFANLQLRIERAPNVRNIEQYIARVDEMVGRKRALILPGRDEA